MAGPAFGLTVRRLAAAAVDGVLFLALAGLAAAALYQASGGRLRTPSVFPLTRCEAVSEVPPQVAEAARRALGASIARPTGGHLCRRSFLGLETGRFVSVRLEAQDGETLISASVFQPVDLAGRPVEPLALGWTFPLAFILLASLLEARLGGTPGKTALALKLASAQGGRAPFARVLVRNLVLYAWLLAWIAWRFVLPEVAPALPHTLATLGWLQGFGAGTVAALALASLAMLLAGRPDPAYDRWTGLRVVRA